MPCSLPTVCTSDRRLRGFTLVELLVVVAIIGGLIALLLPAIQAARESARRARCQNNLRQVGVALLHFEQQHGTLPIGCDGYGLPAPGQPYVRQRLISWNVRLLPFLEEHALWDAYQVDIPSYDLPNSALGATPLLVFLCPSTSNDRLLSTSGGWRGQAFTDYGGIYGVEGTGRDITEADSPSGQHLNDESLGTLLYNVPVSLRQITDGTAHTVAVGEAQLRRESTMEWACGHNIFAQEQTNPINGSDRLGNELGSPHPGGAQVVFCDGHVEYLADETEQSLVVALLTKAGGESR